MDLTLSDEQQLLRQTVREVCAKHSTTEHVRALERDERGYSEALWRELAALDLLGLLVDEGRGGAGATVLEVVCVATELGRALAPSPFVETAVLAPRLLDDLDGITSGDRIVALAWHEAGRSDGPDGVGARADGGRVSGEKILVAFAGAADVLLTPARDGEGVGVYAVTREHVTLERMHSLASDDRWLVRFDAAPAERVGSWDDFTEAMTDALLAVGAYALGGAARAHELSVEYANERVQFGKPIGAFQAMSHPLADLATEIAGAEALLHQAAWARTDGRPARTLAAMAKRNACAVFRRTAKWGHQVFGGVGFTLDIDIQLYSRRAKQLETMWWGPAALDEIVAAAELDGDEPYVTPDAVPSAAR